MNQTSFIKSRYEPTQTIPLLRARRILCMDQLKYTLLTSEINPVNCETEDIERTNWKNVIHEKIQHPSKTLEHIKGEKSHTI